MASLDERRCLDLYRQYWSSVCTGCLGWTDERVREFADSLINEDVPMVLHEKPGYWIAEAFIPTAALNLPQPQKDRLFAEIIEAIDPGDDYHVRHTESDCAELLDRVASVLHAHGLADPRS